MNDKLSFCLEITNWCNLNCAHCCNMSGPTEPKRFMPSAVAKQLITQFTEIEFPKTEYICIGGGEPMLVYDLGEKEYIPRVLSAIFDVGAIPTIKTNAIWGKHAEKRKSILESLAHVAYKYQKLVTLDISLDEFHKNTLEVANIISDIIKSDILCPAIRIFLAGFDTAVSLKKQGELHDELTRRGIQIIKQPIDATPVTDETKYDFGAVYHGQGNKIFVSLNNQIHSDGRAAITGVATTGPSTGMPSIDGNCLIVKNTDTAVLNYKFHEKIAGRNLNTVVQSLMAKMYQAQGR